LCHDTAEAEVSRAEEFDVKQPERAGGIDEENGIGVAGVGFVCEDKRRRPG
jgi:hypothetical protein